ncbi:hypothetical protein F2Q68_00016048 [Brassica cretica]|uniref:Uncharacterized protein n=1 Tax=Brassica cretica TaxID=69181 RepID=A0A8S9H9Z5_BRACR|nr:hypothetical protein F2Q68_00016048 [Brassica cretica]
MWSGKTEAVRPRAWTRRWVKGRFRFQMTIKDVGSSMCDVPQSMDKYMEPAPHGDQDVLNNSNETTELTVPELVFPDHLDILRTIVELDLAWVVKNLKTDMDSHPADHPDSPAGVLIVTVVHLSGSDEPGQ